MSVLIGTHRAQQEREYRGYRWLWFGVPPYVTNLPPPGTVIVRQYVPLRHTPSLLWPGVEPTNPTVTPIFPPGTVIGRQELPDHPRSALWFGIPPDNPLVNPVPPPGKLIYGQQYPLDHPLPRLWAGLQQIQNIATPAQIGRIGVFREEVDYPRHPRSKFVNGPMPHALLFPLPGIAIGSVERPHHPAPFLFAGQFPVAYEERQFFIIA